VGNNEQLALYGVVDLTLQADERARQPTVVEPGGNGHPHLELRPFGRDGDQPLAHDDQGADPGLQLGYLPMMQIGSF